MGHYWREMASEEELRKHDEECERASKHARLEKELTPEKLTKRLDLIEKRLRRLERS